MASAAALAPRSATCCATCPPSGSPRSLAISPNLEPQLLRGHALALEEGVEGVGLDTHEGQAQLLELVAVRDPAGTVTYDARRFSEAFLAVGDTATGVLEVVWTAEQVEPQPER